MLTTQLAADPGRLLNLVRHHARNVEHIVMELLATIPFVLGSDTEEWKMLQSRGGANSFSLRGRGQQYHFRANGTGAIYVFDSYRNGQLIGTIRTRNEARAYIESLVP